MEEAVIAAVVLRDSLRLENALGSIAQVLERRDQAKFQIEWRGRSQLGFIRSLARNRETEKQVAELVVGRVGKAQLKRKFFADQQLVVPDPTGIERRRWLQLATSPTSSPASPTFSLISRKL